MKGTARWLKSTVQGSGWVLLATFITQKLTGAITWSWIWVTSPLWLPVSILAVFLAGAFVTGFVKGVRS